MSDHVAGFERTQRLLLPDTLDGYVDEDNEVRFIDAFVDSLDLKELGFRRAEPKEMGRPSYDPYDLLKLYVYGYLNQVRSSRKLERECHRNMEVMWLMKKLAPDFKTIADFRKDNVDCVKKVFREFLYHSMELGLVGGELVSLDGTKFKAVNSKERNLNLKTLADRLRRIEEKIEKYLEEVEANDRREEEASSQHEMRRQGKLRERIQKLREKMSLYSGLLNRLKESDMNELSLTDPDSRLMKDRGRMDVCYNTHMVVDSKNHVIVEYEATNNASDNNSLSRMAKNAKEALRVERLQVTADKGFFSQEEIKECVDNGITPYLPEPKKSTRGYAKAAGIPTPEFYEEKFHYDERTDTYTCPAGETLRFRYWQRNGEGEMVGLYMTDGACFTCPFFMVKCTRNRRKGRVIQRWVHEGVLEEMRWRIKLEPEKLELRRDLSEHPFGTMKRAFNQGYLLLKGLRKVNGEVGFTMLTYNMRRAINILGARALIASLG
jgi:transposase